MVSFWTITCILVTCAAVVGRSAAQIAPSQSQPPAEGPGTAADCSTLIYNMMDCMTFLSNGDNETKPDAPCCSGFKSVVDTDAECICYAISTAASLGMDINMTKAETIPSSCGVTGVPPISSCSASASPGASPANPPAANTPSVSPTLPPTTQPPAAASPTTQPPSAASPTTEPPSAASSPGGAPAALSPSGTTGAPAPAPAHKKSGAYTISATSSTLFIILYPLSLLFTA